MTEKELRQLLDNARESNSDAYNSLINKKFIHIENKDGKSEWTQHSFIDTTPDKYTSVIFGIVCVIGFIIWACMGFPESNG
jgi:hypothetical protein